MGRRLEYSHNGERGAALYEAAITIPLILLLVLALISFMQSLTARIIYTDGLRLAGRLAAVQDTNCAGTAQNWFRKYVSELGFSPGNAQPQVSVVLRGGVRTLIAEAHMKISCPMCGIIPKLGNIDVSYAVPLEDQSAGC
jgi:Flp pilus assembly protein TadG